METSISRTQYIEENYSIKQLPSGEWEALNLYQGRVAHRIAGFDRDRVVYEASCRWGHFNFQDEADTFYRIFHH